jgi:hypothetical protein
VCDGQETRLQAASAAERDAWVRDIQRCMGGNPAPPVELRAGETAGVVVTV